ncbi:V-set and immunoglobulin domain-containing protein 10-like [Tiliqua scincoides]|uniref:V-set and immunoglobulin domain-containing protein 10-like n=1 Tax=Tiliqua scincoides TaxID=71010 RepID=UPI00346334CF
METNKITMVMSVSSPFPAPVISALSPAPLPVLVGSSVSLAVPFPLPSSQLQTSITWRLNGTSVAQGVRPNLHSNFTIEIAPEYKPRFSVDPVRGNLNITAVNLSDSGFYVVEVSQLSSTLQTGNITLRVYEQVGLVSVSPPSAEATEGTGSITLTCHPIRGTVSWTKDGQILPENPRYLTSGGSLKINQPLQNDTGVYRCTVSNPFGNGTADSRLTVYYGPETPTITISSSSDQDPEDGHFVLVNSSVNLTCLAPSLPPAAIYWNVADIQNPNVPSLPVLQLQRVQLNEAGTYSCLAINQHTHRSVRNTRNLVVAQRPAGAPLCSMTATSNGTALFFSCSWLGGSPVPSLTFQGLPGLQEGVNASSLQRLLASPLPAGLNGTRITCLGRHLTGQGNCSVTPEAPSGVSLSFRAYNVTGGPVTMELHCQGTFNPVKVAWFRDGQPLVPAPVGGRYQLSLDGMHLSIWNFTAPQDLGTYSVNCSNPLGSQHSNLTVIGPSIAEWTLSHGSSPGSAYVTWTVPNGSAVTSFWIQMQDSKQSHSAEEWKTVEEAGATNRSSNLVGLDPQTSYAFRIVPLLGPQMGNSSSVQILKPPDSQLSAGAIAGIVIGSICGVLLLIALLVLLIFCFLRRRDTKVPPTPPENRQHYLSRQFPNGNTLEPNDPSWGNPRWSAGDSDIYAITYDKHLSKYGVPTTLPTGTMNSGVRPSAAQPGTKNIRTATQV